MTAVKETVNEVVIWDSVSDELQKLRVVFTFLSQISDTAHEEEVQFIGNWNVKYFDAAMLTLGESIDVIQEIIHPEEDGTS